MFWILQHDIILKCLILLVSHRRSKILKLQRCSSLAGITQHCGELYKRCKAESNNLDVPPEDRSHWALTEPWRHLIRHLSCSLQTISWARLESILGRSLPTQTDRRTLKYDGWREREHKPLSTERDSIYTYNISSQRRLVGGAETEHFREPTQTDVGHRRRHFHSRIRMSALPVELARRFPRARAFPNVRRHKNVTPIHRVYVRSECSASKSAVTVKANLDAFTEGCRTAFKPYVLADCTNLMSFMGGMECT